MGEAAAREFGPSEKFALFAGVISDPNFYRSRIVFDPHVASYLRLLLS